MATPLSPAIHLGADRITPRISKLEHRSGYPRVPGKPSPALHFFGVSPRVCACGAAPEGAGIPARRTASAPKARLLRPQERDRVFFFQAEDGIRDDLVTGVQTCALPI